MNLTKNASNIITVVKVRVENIDLRSLSLVNLG